MSSKKIPFIALISLVLFASQGIGQTVKVMSYNIKYDNANDTLNNWNDRKSAMVVLLKKQHPAFIGMQEVLFNQLEYLDASLDDHNYLGVGRDDGKEKGEFSPIFYNFKEYTLLESGTFWLSETPDKISVGWDAALERICSYGLFQNNASRKKLWVFNTHFDHRGEKARENSAKLILKKIKQLNSENLPVIFMGDLNLMPQEKPIQLINKKMDDGQHISKVPFQGPNGTFNGFDTNDPMKKRIDYIFTKGFEVKNYRHIDERLENGKHISDHLPVFTSIAIQ